MSSPSRSAAFAAFAAGPAAARPAATGAGSAAARRRAASASGSGSEVAKAVGTARPLWSRGRSEWGWSVVAGEGQPRIEEGSGRGVAGSDRISCAAMMGSVRRTFSALARIRAPRGRATRRTLSSRRPAAGTPSTLAAVRRRPRPPLRASHHPARDAAHVLAPQGCSSGAASAKRRRGARCGSTPRHRDLPTQPQFAAGRRREPPTRRR